MTRNSFQSAYPETPWPALIGGRAASLLSILFQLEQTEWWTPEQIAEEQFRQLAQVVEHAWRTVPFYRERFEAINANVSQLASPDGWRRIPLLSRRDIQTAGESLHSTNVPKTHGRISRMLTSGSTGQPVPTLGTELTEFFWRAFTLRDHFWHGRDFTQPFAAIRATKDAAALPPDGRRADNWGHATAGIINTGPAFLLSVQTRLEEQLDWLERVAPGYVLAYPSALFGIAELLERRGLRLPQLRELRTFGEILEPECRAFCERIFGAKVVDMYSSQEVGYLALQCPGHEHYHVMAENLLVEILDDEGQPCQPGETGRVVVSTLHNFAMPLIRYEIGDYAEVGAPCPCGRGLPTLRRIVGRQRNLLVMPDGQRRWPVFDAGDRPEELPPIFQFQVIQRTPKQLDVNVVRHADFSPQEAAELTRYLHQTLGYPFEITIRRVEVIPRGPNGKFEDFISLVPADKA
jgi:phenylacetate-CoA ligase